MTTMKTLFVMSGNVCAFLDPDPASREPGCEQQLTDPKWESVKACICHIAGRKPGRARYDESMTDKQRAEFDNLILICPNQHLLIDKPEPGRAQMARIASRGW
jgi:hypothetical protein